MFRFAFGKLGSLSEFQAAFLTVAPKQPEHRVGMRSKVGQRLVDRRGQRRKFLEVLIVRRPLFRLLPQIFNRIVIRRIRWQRIRREPLAVGRQKLLGRLAGMIPCSIMNEKQVLRGMSHDHGQEYLGTVRGESALNTLGKQSPREIVNSPKYLGALPLATGFDLGLLASARPGVTQRAPLCKAGCILKQDQTLPTLGSTQDLRPVFLEPGKPTRGVEMIRHK